jgi:hypothetical protein
LCLGAADAPEGQARRQAGVDVLRIEKPSECRNGRAIPKAPQQLSQGCRSLPVATQIRRPPWRAIADLLEERGNGPCITEPAQGLDNGNRAAGIASVEGLEQGLERPGVPDGPQCGRGCGGGAPVAGAQEGNEGLDGVWGANAPERPRCARLDGRHLALQRYA